MKKYHLFTASIIFLLILSSCQKSNINELSELSISTGDLVPKFSKNITEYSVTSLNSLNKIIITAVPKDGNAKVIINDSIKSEEPFRISELGKDLRIKISVTAENGEKKNYYIKCIPENYPKIDITINKTKSSGYLYITNFVLEYNYRLDIGRYIMMLDNSGTPVFYKNAGLGAADFRKQLDGSYTYFICNHFKPPEIFGVFVRLDSNFNMIDEYRVKHGYTDLHDFQILKNGNSLALGVDIISMDLTKFGGKHYAKIWDYFLEETDKNDDVVFEWKSWDHFKVTDILKYYDLTKSYIEHGVNVNSVFIDKDDNIIISSRKLDEITKINHKTGEIIWRMGGRNCKNNQFKFIGDPLKGFSHQHCVQRLSNGNLLMFDNGNFNSDKAGMDNIFFVATSRIVEYQIDEVQKTAKLVWEYKEPKMFVPLLGSCQRLSNGNTLICWSKAQPAITEITPAGEKVFEMNIPEGFQIYKAYKY